VYNNDATGGKDGTETAQCENGCGVPNSRTAAGTVTNNHNYVNGVCSVCKAEDPNYVPVGTEDNPQSITEGEHAVTVGSYKSHYYTYTATQEGILTITVSGENWAANLFRYNAEGKRLKDKVDVRRGYANDSNVFVVAL
jgi:hypothetical protein